jgi:inorganic pyrophosphatase
MSFHQVPVGTDVPNDINVIIEIPMNSPALKYEVDKKSGTPYVDRNLERGKWVKVEGWEDAESARREIVEAIECFQSEAA